MRVLDEFLQTFSSQVTSLIQLPDVPGQVVQVHQVIFQLSSFSAAAAITVILDHNVNENVTLSVTARRGSRWFASDQGASGGGPAPTVHRFEPPYELIGVQRIDRVASAGSAAGRIVIHYTVRREPNRTLWNELRGRTSFERD